jgi:hypothetical protein
MKFFSLIVFLGFSLGVAAQQERDTVLTRCPVFITDTVSANNFFLEFQPSTLKVYRNKGKLTVQVQQKDQFFTVFFRDKKLKTNKYKIAVNADSKNEVEAKYSFRSGSSASFVDLSSGTIESTYDKEKQLWHIRVRGMLANLVERSVTYYRVRADFFILN